MTPNLTVVIPTLGQNQEHLRLLLRQLSEQTLERKRWTLVVWQKTPADMNEYDQINKALRNTRFSDPQDVFIALGDDCEVDPDYLEKGLSFFEQDPGLKVMTVGVEGNMWGSGWHVDARDHLGQGTSIWARHGAWEAVGGYQVDWGLKIPVRGWRSDSGLLYAIIDLYGERAYVWTDKVRVKHPGQAQSPWEPLVERVFWRRFRKHMIRYMLPIDPRLAQMVIAAQLASEGDPEDKEGLAVASKVIEEFIAKGTPRETFDEGIKQIRQLFQEYDAK